MNKLLLLTLLLLSPVCLKAQEIALSAPLNPYHGLSEASLLNRQATALYLDASDNTDYFYQVMEDAKPKHRLVKIGKTLTFVGIPLVVLGAVMVSGADAITYNCVNGECEGDAAGAFGALILAGGAGMTTTGIILWSIGAKKSR